MDLRNQRPTNNYIDVGLGKGVSYSDKTNPPNTGPLNIPTSILQPRVRGSVPAPPWLQRFVGGLDAPPPQQVASPPAAPITLPPEGFRDPSQFVTPMAPPQAPQISTTPPSQEIDIPEIRNQALRLPNSLPSGIPGIEIRPGNKMPIRGRYRF